MASGRSFTAAIRVVCRTWPATRTCCRWVSTARRRSIPTAPRARRSSTRSCASACTGAARRGFRRPPARRSRRSPTGPTAPGSPRRSPGPRASPAHAAAAARVPSAARAPGPRAPARSRTCAKRSSAARADGLESRPEPPGWREDPPIMQRVLGIHFAALVATLGLGATALSVGAPKDAARLAAAQEDARVAAWRKARLARLPSDSGWLTLVGLFWLKEGENTFRRASSNALVLDHAALAPPAGRFVLTDHRARFIAAPGSGV